jgi:hypothetical protein
MLLILKLKLKAQRGLGMPMRRGGAIIAAGVLLASAAPALGQQPTPQQIDAIKSACRWDFMSNCSGVPRGGREALMCLKDHLEALSAGCRTAVSAIIPKTPPARPAAAPAAPPPPPAPAAAAAPPAAHPTPPAAAATATAPTTPAPAASTTAPPPPAPKKHASAPPPAKLTRPAAAPAPKHAVAAPPPAPAPAPQPADLGPIPPLRPIVRLRILNACKAEHDAMCGQVLPGQGRIVECLAAHGAALSPPCRDAILSAK